MVDLPRHFVEIHGGTGVHIIKTYYMRITPRYNRSRTLKRHPAFHRGSRNQATAKFSISVHPARLIHAGHPVYPKVIVEPADLNVKAYPFCSDSSVFLQNVVEKQAVTTRCRGSLNKVNKPFLLRPHQHLVGQWFI